MAEPYIIKMPQLSDTMTEGVLVSWEKNIGDKIERGTIVATVETDKAIMDVEVFREGYLSGPLAAVDSTVPVGEAIAFLVASQDEVQEAGADAPASTAGAAESEPTAGKPPQRKRPRQRRKRRPPPAPPRGRCTPSPCSSSRTP